MGQLLFFFLVRFAISLEFPILYVFIFELYPAQVSVISFSLGSLMWNMPNIFLPELINIMNQHGFPVMIMTSIVIVIAMAALYPLKETYGQPQEMIE